MYARKTEKTVKGKTYTNHMLVESVSTPKGPRQKVVCSLGDLRPRPRAEWLKLAHKVECALVGQGDMFEPDDAEVQSVVEKVKRRRARQKRSAAKTRRGQSADEDLIAIHTNAVEVEQVREAGTVHVGIEFWKRLDLETILAEAGLNAKARVLTCVMTMNRLIHPGSERATPNWVRSTGLAEIVGEDFSSLDKQSLYRNMDRLHPKRARIESALAERERNLFSLDHTILFYDLTSTYFEGEALCNPKAKRGYSRDKRPDCKQVLVALVINGEGFPVAHEVLAGNVQDCTTVGQMLDILDQRLGLEPGQTVVVDRGMAFAKNLEEITSRSLKYIVACRQSERNEHLDEFEDTDGFEDLIRQPSPRNPAQKKSRVSIKISRGDGEIRVLCISEGRREKDRAIREKHEKLFLADVKKLQAGAGKGRLKKDKEIHEAVGRLKERYPRVARYYGLSYSAEEGAVLCPCHEEKRAIAEKLDGSYILKTNRTELSAEQIWRIYILLTRVESAFRAMKSPLAERPIFHQLEHRVETHIFLCVLAYHLLVSIEKTLLDQGVHTSWETVRETLRTHQVCTVVLPAENGMTLKIRRDSKPEKEHLELYRLLDVPVRIMRPIRTWMVPKDEI